jgi:hypothetical protein
VTRKFTGFACEWHVVVPPPGIKYALLATAGSRNATKPPKNSAASGKASVGSWVRTGASSAGELAA